MVIFGDSYADTGRVFSAPAAHQFEEYGIGAFPWRRLYAAPDSDDKIPAYVPFEGSVTNGKAWPTWLRVPDEHNFATSSATASSPFRNLDPCQGYTGVGEEFPTGTLEEQITRYFHDIGDPLEETLDYTHIIALGINDLLLASWTMSRYGLGGADYLDPVPFHLVFQTDNITGLPVLDDNGLPVATFEPAVEAAIKAWDDGIGRLVEAGVTGTILLANIPAAKGLPLFFNTTSADFLDSFAVQANFGASQLALKYPQVKILDAFSLTSALVDNPSIFEDLGFIAPEGSSLAIPCMSLNFAVDSTAEIMGTQVLANEMSRGRKGLQTRGYLLSTKSPPVAGTTINLTRRLARLLLSVVFAQEDTAAAQRANKYKQWRLENPPDVCLENPPQMVIFGDSYADAGRAFNAPAAHQFEEYEIGPFPWARLYAAPGSDEKIPAYMPFEGSVTNGKAWPTWLRVPDEHNFATSSATASSPFRNVDPCQGYTGVGEEFPTGTLAEQITRYFHDIGDPPQETLGFTHIIALGINDLLLASWAMMRYALGGADYQDPVPFHLVFETDNVTGLPVLDDNGLPVATFEPAVEATIKAWDEGIGRLVEAGVIGTILLANIPAVKALPLLFNTTIADFIDSFAVQANDGARQLALKYPQVKILDTFSLTSALVDNPSIFEELGFIAPESSLIGPCMDQKFAVDSLAEVMNTQALRHPDCQETCALCADGTSPCQNCLEGNPSITVCEDPSTRVFYDAIHYTTEYNLVLGETIRQCSKDMPNYDRPLVSVLCPPDGRPNKYKKWRQENPPKIVVFGDSNSDVGRSFNAPAAYQFEKYGIGPFPWEMLYAAPDSNETVPAYLPFEGSVSNGKAWPTWLRIPDIHNFGTSSATASSAFRQQQSCTAYTGEGEEVPTGTLEEQITRYFHDIDDALAQTLDYTHMIGIGGNDLIQAGGAIARYTLGGPGYQDPIGFELVFETDNVTGFPALDDDGMMVPSFDPVVEEVVKAWDDGIGRLVQAGVNGTILLANLGAVKGLAGFIGTEDAVLFDSVAYEVNRGASLLATKYSQVKVLDMFSLLSALVDEPSIFEDLGFVAPADSFLAEPCVSLNFTVDSTAEIMGTQALRHPDCRGECALCADAVSPCQNCLEGNPSITVCDDPYTRSAGKSTDHNERRIITEQAPRRIMNLLRSIGIWLFTVKLGSASECLVGCTLMGLDPFDSDQLVEWDDRSTCDDSAGCEVNTGDTLTTWVGCGGADASRCLWASSSGEDGSSDCTCSVCGTANSFASSYMSDYPTWTRIACYVADMEWVGYDASECVAAVVDDGAMACVDEAYEVPTVDQFSCPSTGISLNTNSNCFFDGSLREAEEMFEIVEETPPTPAPSLTSSSVDDDTPVDTPGPTVAEAATDDYDDSTQPASSSSELSDTPTAPEAGIEGASGETDDAAAGGDDELSAGAITGIVIAILVVIGGGGLAVKFGSINCCHSVNISDSNISSS
eukprot:g7520.t1